MESTILNPVSCGAGKAPSQGQYGPIGAMLPAKSDNYLIG
jgi:hypothetical protein